MEVTNKKPTFLPETKLLSLIAKTREKFLKEFKKYNDDTTRTVYLQVLEELKKAISNGNFNYFKNLCNAIEYISSIIEPAKLKEYYDDADNSIKESNIVILICQYQKIDMLKYIFNFDNKTILNLSVDVGVSILPNSKDYKNKSAFYYAISNENINFLDTLIATWPNEIFKSNPEILDEVLGEAYEELKLKGTPLIEEMKIFVEDKLINLRFYSNGQNTTATNINNIKERIQLLLCNIKLLHTEYCAKHIDDRFLFIAKFIAQNIHILKRQLKSTYNRLPWEEIEFCLICFITSQIKMQPMTLFCRVTLNKTKMLGHLQYFAKRLEEQLTNIQNLSIKAISKLPNINRNKAIKEITRNNPAFEELYEDYKKIMDVYSLQKINNCINLALTADPNEIEGHCLITRVLQIIGEYLKNTLESPKLSDSTSERLLLSLPKNTRTIIIDLRNSLSHADSLLKRTEIEENTNVKYFIGIQNDIKIINDVIHDILFNVKMDLCEMLLKQIMDSRTIEELQDIADLLKNVDLLDIASEYTKTTNQSKIEKIEILLKKIMSIIPKEANFKMKQLQKIQSMIYLQKQKEENTKPDYLLRLSALHSLSLMDEIKIDKNVIRCLKYTAKEALKTFEKLDSEFLEQFTNTTLNFFKEIISSNLKNYDYDDDKLNRCLMEMLYLVQVEPNMKWIDGLRDKLNEMDTKKTNTIAVEKQLTRKLTELKSLLKQNALTSINEIMKKYKMYKNNDKLKTTIEMLVLDIMSILDNNLENNLLFLEAPSPLLIGKSLRNHLAHYNTLVDVLLFEPSIAILLNAKKLTEENLIKNKRKIGQLVNDDPLKLKQKFERDLASITNQQKMFKALEEGNLENVKKCFRNGADLKSKSFNSWTALHFAAKGPSLEVVKFVLDHNSNIEDIEGKKPLHVAAENGRKNIVEYFINKLHISVDDADDSGQTSLHYACINGHKGTVEMLLKYDADVTIKDMKGLPALHCAINNNYIDIAKLLLKKDMRIDINETLGGYTPLHTAAERGYVKLVKFLLENNAYVDAKTDKEWIPLHGASFNGYVEIVNILIEYGADINASALNGCTVLHYAVENGHEDVVDVLLKHGASVNVIDKSYKNSPLHYASKDGYEGIVQALLKHKAYVNVTTYQGMTPLHFASVNGHSGIVVALLQHGANINAKNLNHCTPLHLAAAKGHVKIVEILLENNANANAMVNVGHNCLHAAVSYGHLDVVKTLIRNKSDVNKADFGGKTPLHIAAQNGNVDIIKALLKNNADINVKCKQKYTPLCEAASSGNIKAVQILLEHNAIINDENETDISPLHLAVTKGHTDITNFLIENKASVTDLLLDVALLQNQKEIVKILLKHGVNVNRNGVHVSPLTSAVKHNHKEIVEILIANGADVNCNENGPITIAIFSGNTDIVKMLLSKVNVVNIPHLLHIAAAKGYTKIVKILLEKGADVNTLDSKHYTPLHCAASGHADIVELLILNGAKVNVATDDGTTPLHLAAGGGHHNIVKILLENGADVNIRDKKNRAPFELAIGNEHLQIVKTLLQYTNYDLNDSNHDIGTILHIGALKGNLAIVKYLVEAGCDINARNKLGSKPIHIAAREGFKDIVDFFLSKGLNINDPGAVDQTLLHYAALNGQFEFVKYLVLLNIDLNAKDANGQTALHFASIYGHQNIIELLLKHGAIYNSLNNTGLKPVEMTKHENIIKLFTTIDKLFKSVKRNNITDVKECIKLRVEVNAKSVENGMPIHYAVCKGYEDIAQFLLKNKANPNAIADKGYTPLHYAAKFSHFNLTKMLLSSGAIYNAVSNTGKSPIDFAEDTNINNLLKFIDGAFKNVQNNNLRIINDINKINDIDRVRAIMSARNKQNKNLVVVAIHNNFTKIEQLKYILQGDVQKKIIQAYDFVRVNLPEQGIKILINLLERSREIVGDNSPGTFDIQSCLSKVYYKQGNYMKALYLLQELYEKQKDILGVNNKDTLSTRSSIALILHRQGKDKEAISIFQEVYEKEKEILGPKHVNILNTQLHMALTLDKLGRYDEALEINKRVYHLHKEMSGADHENTIRAQNNIAMVLGNQGKTEQAIKLYRQIYEKKKNTLGAYHADTLRTLHSIASHLHTSKQYQESLIAFEELFEHQTKHLGANHPDTLNTQWSIADILFEQGKWIGALKTYKECLNQRIMIFGEENPVVLNMQERIKLIQLRLHMEGSNVEEILYYWQKEIIIAARDGDLITIRRLIESRTDLNVQDIDGRTPLHFAVNNRHLQIIELLLENKADPTNITKKGNTILHTAVLNGSENIVNLLLNYVKDHFSEKFNSFIEAKTIKAGTSALHVACKNNFINIVKTLMKFGTIYNSTNNSNQTPLDVSTDSNIIDLLMLTDDLFKDVQNGKIETIAKLQKLEKDIFIAVTNTRNSEENTLLQVAILNKHKIIAQKLLRILKKCDIRTQV